MGTASDASTVCLQNAAQVPAWSCDMPPASLQVTISKLGAGAPKTSNHAFSVQLPADAPHQFAYGTQPPVFKPKNVMTLVTDFDDPHLGPAWFFQLNFDKIVVLPQEVLTVPSTAGRRRREVEEVDATAVSSAPTTDANTLPTSSSTSSSTASTTTPSAPATNNYSPDDRPPPIGGYRRNIAAAGSTPWFCYFNGTLLETFVYPNATSQASEKWTSLYGASPTTASGYGKRSDTSTPTSSSSTAGATSATEGLLPPYPKVIKIEERRMPRGNYDQPYCVQMRISGDGVTAVPVKGEDGNAVVITLDESSGTTTSGKRDAAREVRAWELGRRESLQDCHCGWVAE